MQVVPRLAGMAEARHKCTLERPELCLQAPQQANTFQQMSLRCR
jgi:hypothetical protein